MTDQVLNASELGIHLGYKEFYIDLGIHLCFYVLVVTDKVLEGQGGGGYIVKYLDLCPSCHRVDFKLHLFSMNKFQHLVMFKGHLHFFS